MRLGRVTIRLAALIVLLTSASDYWAYDQWDPTAPMNSTGPDAIAVFASHTTSTVSLRCIDLPDDHCLAALQRWRRQPPFSLNLASIHRWTGSFTPSDELHRRLSA